jgi:hypothetical protein
MFRFQRAKESLTNFIPGIDFSYLSHVKTFEFLENIISTIQQFERVGRDVNITKLESITAKRFGPGQWDTVQLGFIKREFEGLQVVIEAISRSFENSKEIVLGNKNGSVVVLLQAPIWKKFGNSSLISLQYAKCSTSDPLYQEFQFMITNYQIIKIDDVLLELLIFVLELNQRYLSPQTVQQFRTQMKPMHCIVKPSFLIPHHKVTAEDRSGFIDLIHKSLAPPTAFLEEAMKLCDYCFLKLGNKKCSNCKNKIYCSRDCQDADWKVHREECQKPVHKEETAKQGRSILCASSMNKNIDNHYGERQFLAKVQVPVDGSIGNVIITDQLSKLKFYITNRSHCVSLIQVVKKNGVIGSTQVRIIGYFFAKQEGKCLRIWLDELPPQTEVW